MTDAELLILRNHISNSPDLQAFPPGLDGSFAIAVELNKLADPTYIVWKNNVLAQEVMENGFVWTAVDSLTIGKARIWEWLTRFGSFDPSKPNVRQGLADCFGANSAISTAIQPHLKREASRFEKLFSSGVGSVGSPGTMTLSSPVSYEDVERAR